MESLQNERHFFRCADGLSVVGSSGPDSRLLDHQSQTATRPGSSRLRGPSVLCSLILALATLAIAATGFQTRAQADGPRIDFSSAFADEEISDIELAPMEIERAIQATPPKRKVRVYNAPFFCKPCENQKTAFANVAEVADVEYVVGGPAWITGYPAVHIVDVNRLVTYENRPDAYGRNGAITVEGLKRVLDANQPEGVVGLGTITVGTVTGREAVAALIKSTHEATGQKSGTVRINFEGHGPQSLTLAPNVSLAIRDPITIRYTWQADKVDVQFSPASSITVRANGLQTGIDGITADVDKVVIDLPGWLTPSMRIRLK